MTSEGRELGAEIGWQFREAAVDAANNLDVLMQRVRRAAITGQFGYQYMDWDDCETDLVDEPDRKGAG